MNRGVIYIMSTAVLGLIKIGKTKTEQFSERMRHLESNGYYNVVGLKRAFAIEVDDYDKKEAMLHEVFAKHRVGDSELFALNIDLVQQLLLAFEGKIVFPEKVNRQERFDEIDKSRTADRRFNFYRRGIEKGDVITFRYDETIVATVVGEREVEYEGYNYKLSPLTRKIMEELGRGNKSGAYQGSQFWCYGGKMLSQIPIIE